MLHIGLLKKSSRDYKKKPSPVLERFLRTQNQPHMNMHQKMQKKSIYGIVVTPY